MGATLGRQGRRWAKRLVGLSLVAVVAAAAVVLVREGGALLSQPIRLNPLLVMVASVTAYGGVLLAVLLWRSVLAAFGVHQPAATDLRFYAYSALGVALPGSIWPMVGRAVLYQRVGENSLSVATATAVEVCVTGVAGMAVYAAVVIFRPGVGLLSQPVFGYVAAAVTLALLSPPVFNRLSNTLLRRAGRPADAEPIRLSAGHLFGWCALACVIIVIGGASLYLLLNSLVAAPPEVLPPLVAAWAAATAVGSLLFWMPATSLLRDGALVLALTPALTAPVAILFAALARVWSIGALFLLAALIWLWYDSPLARLLRRRGLINP